MQLDISQDLDLKTCAKLQYYRLGTAADGSCESCCPRFILVACYRAFEIIESGYSNERRSRMRSYAWPSGLLFWRQEKKRKKKITYAPDKCSCTTTKPAGPAGEIRYRKLFPR